MDLENFSWGILLGIEFGPLVSKREGRLSHEVEDDLSLVTCAEGDISQGRGMD